MNLPGRDISTWYEDAASVIRRAFQSDKENFTQLQCKFSCIVLHLCWRTAGLAGEINTAMPEYVVFRFGVISQARYLRA